MNKRQDGEGHESALAPFVGRESDEPLAYVVELWTLSRDRAERVIGRAASAAVAQAIFTAAQSEHLGRRIVLRRGAKVLAEAG
ncbi:hypothetical protein ACO2Q0_05295 [Phenylobacterium sp. VNQ135]|uniref:hypothetical protein n=1 Tax=Phenylobacterium sp. VNQ135 TaxID=3400922 RepID=UPI003C11B908